MALRDSIIAAATSPERLEIERRFIFRYGQKLKNLRKEVYQRLYQSGGVKRLQQIVDESRKIEKLNRRKNYVREQTKLVFSQVPKLYFEPLIRTIYANQLIAYELGAVEALRVMGFPARSRNFPVKAGESAVVFKLTDDEIRDSMLGRAIRHGAGISDNVIEDARLFADRDIINGDGTVESVRNSIIAADPTVPDWRALKIARTETHQGFSRAQYNMYDRSGVKMKEWLTVGDQRVRDNHSDNEAEGKVKMDYVYPNGQTHPGDGIDSINCRCALQPSLEDPKLLLEPWDGRPVGVVAQAAKVRPPGWDLLTTTEKRHYSYYSRVVKEGVLLKSHELTKYNNILRKLGLPEISQGDGKVTPPPILKPKPIPKKKPSPFAQDKSPFAVKNPELTAHEQRVDSFREKFVLGDEPLTANTMGKALKEAKHLDDLVDELSEAIKRPRAAVKELEKKWELLQKEYVTKKQRAFKLFDDFAEKTGYPKYFNPDTDDAIDYVFELKATGKITRGEVDDLLAAYHDMQSASSRVTQLFEEFNKADGVTAKDARTAIRKILKSKFSKRVKFTSKFDGISSLQQSEVDKGLDYLDDVIRDTGGDKVNRIRFFRSQENRAGYYPRGPIAGDVELAYDDLANTVVHEVGHAIDYQVMTPHTAENFLKYRIGAASSAERRTVVKFRDKFPNWNFKDYEKGARDEFDWMEFVGKKNQASPYYTGKIYPGDPRGEIVSMGMEYFYMDPIKMIAEDREFTKFILGVMDGSFR
jgi:hypothetical protein